MSSILPPPPPPPPAPVEHSGPEHQGLHAGPIAPPPPPPLVGGSGSHGGRSHAPFVDRFHRPKPAGNVVINTAPAKAKPHTLETVRDLMRTHARNASPGPDLAKMDAPDQAAASGRKAYGVGASKVPMSKLRRARAANGVWQSYANGERGEGSDAAAGLKGAMHSRGKMAPGKAPDEEDDDDELTGPGVTPEMVKQRSRDKELRLATQAHNDQLKDLQDQLQRSAITKDEYDRQVVPVQEEKKRVHVGLIAKWDAEDAGGAQA